MVLLRTLAGKGNLRSRVSVEDPVSKDGVEGDKSVSPGDFLSVLVASPGIGDRHLVDAPVALRHFHRHFRLEPETVRFQLDSLEHIPAKHLIACLHVRQIQIGDHVGKKSEKFIADIVPK